MAVGEYLVDLLVEEMQLVALKTANALSEAKRTLNYHPEPPSLAFLAVAFAALRGCSPCCGSACCARSASNETEVRSAGTVWVRSIDAA